MPLAREIFYYTLDGFVSIADKFTLNEQQATTMLPTPAHGWLNDPVAVQLNLACVKRYSGITLKEMPHEAFICSTENLRISHSSLSVTELENYSHQLADIEDGYAEGGPEERVLQRLSCMIAAKSRKQKHGVVKKTLTKKTITTVSNLCDTGKTALNAITIE